MKARFRTATSWCAPVARKGSVIPMPRDPEFLNEEEAARLWQRAAQLQAEAAQKAEALAEESESEKADVDPSEGYALTHVRSAALEVGIGGEFVDAALADLRAERALLEGKRGWRLARRILHHSPDTIKVRRVIEAPAADVLSAMWDVFPREPYRLAMTDQTADPLEGGVLVFDIQGLNSPFPEGLALEARHAGIRQVFLSLRPIDGATPSCEVILRGPVDLSHNIGVGLVSAGGAAAGVVRPVDGARSGWAGPGCCPHGRGGRGRRRPRCEGLSSAVRLRNPQGAEGARGAPRCGRRPGSGRLGGSPLRKAASRQRASLALPTRPGNRGGRNPVGRIN